jgi:large repetitive protein
VTVGYQPCTNVTVISSSEIECTLPPSTVQVRASVVVKSGSFSGVLSEVYRYASFTGGPPPPLDPVTSQWRTVTTPTNPIANHDSCFVMGNNGKGYLLGGSAQSNVCEYDPSIQNWSCNRQQPPIKLHSTQCVVVGDEIWLPTAWTGTAPSETSVDSIYIYNIVSNTWRNKTGLALARRRAGAAAQHFNGFIYVSHGNRGNLNNNVAVNWFDQYNIATDQWTTLPNAQFPRDNTGAAIVRGSWFCVAGGRDSGAANFYNVAVLPTECYDLLAGVNGVWATKANIPQGRAGAAYGTSCDGKLIVAGGEGFGQAWKNVDEFDGETWTALPDLKTARHGTGLAVSCKCGGQEVQVHIASGRPCQGTSCSTNLVSTETLFPNGVNVDCVAPSGRRLVMEPPSDEESVAGAWIGATVDQTGNVLVSPSLQGGKDPE